MSERKRSDTGANDPADILLVGHLTKDVLSNDPDGEYRIGGTVSFTSITALRLGRRPTVVTRAATDTDLSELPPEIALCILPSPSTTTFANIYTDQGRIQYCYTPAPPIRAVDIPAALRHPQAVLFGPLVNEIGPDIVQLMRNNTLVAAVPQGWMRRWDETGRVYSKDMDNAADILSHLDILVLSIEDIERDLERLTIFTDHVPLVILTKGKKGCTVYRHQSGGRLKTTDIPPRPAAEVDPTGAGDVFAAAFLIRYQETGDAIQSARFANVTASYAIEGEGVSGIPDRQQVLGYMEQYPFQPKG